MLVSYDQNTQKKTAQTRKTIYFNLSYCQSVNTNIGKTFLQILHKHFKQDQKMNKIINRSNCKISYSA